jgi:hypothetical protein
MMKFVSDPSRRMGSAPIRSKSDTIALILKPPDYAGGFFSVQQLQFGR